MKNATTLGLVLALSLLSACGDDVSDEGGGSDRDGSVGDGDGDGDGDGGPDGGVEPNDNALYALMYEVYDDVASNSYLHILRSLDDIEDLTPSEDREFAGGRAYLATYGGHIYIGSPEEPTVTRYEVADDGELTEAGVVSFANYGLTSGILDAWTVNFISADKAYLFAYEQGLTIIWSPTTMEILGEIEPVDEMFRDGLTINAGAAQVRGNRLFRTLNWADYESYSWSNEGALTVYDTEADELLEVIPRTRCPSADNLSHRDEQGNLYFGNWIWSIANTLMYDGAKNCVLRINDGEEDFDPDYELRFSDIFDGREGANFSYAADGKAFVSAFHDEETSFNDETDPWEYAGTPVWRTYNLDIATLETTPVEGIGESSGAFTPIRLDGRQFLMVPFDGWSVMRIYEITDDTQAELKVEIPGWSYQFVKIR
jgi:hypothetical protein